MKSILEIASQVSEPLGLAGLVCACLFFAARLILNRLVPPVSRTQGARIVIRVLNYLFILALVAVVLGMGGNLLDKIGVGRREVSQELSGSEKDAVQIKNQIVSLLHDFNDVAASAPARANLQAQAPKLYSLMLLVDDRDLSPGFRIYKRLYAAHASVMAAEAMEPLSDKVKYSREAVAHADNALELAAEALRKSGEGRPQKDAADFVIQDEVESRGNYLKSMALCIQSRATKDATIRERAIETCQRIATPFRTRYPLELCQQLKWCNYCKANT